MTGTDYDFVETVTYNGTADTTISAPEKDYGDGFEPSSIPTITVTTDEMASVDFKYNTNANYDKK